MKYDIIVIGGGHAGCEAALASARMDNKTLLLTGNIKNIADAPCNPSIGGPAKGIVVREIDALGGEMAKNTDKSLLQMKMLNTKKGPAVRALRAQIDKVVYQKEMQDTLFKQEKLEIREAMVEDLIIEGTIINGVRLSDGEEIYAKAVIITTGTYMKGCVLYGSTKISSGPHDEKPSLHLSDKLKELGFNIKRLKTGTPPRIERSSIDFSFADLQPGDAEKRGFSLFNVPNYEVEEQIPCYLIYTTPETHEIIKNNLDKSSMYGGFVEGVGPRYCPSIEDKIVKFSDKERHQLFLEPESRSYDDIYIQGFSTSMPHDIQEQMVHSLPGLQNAVINKYAYAIEYDAIDSLQLKPSLETMIVENLYTAGQINGTSGYEEAAGQGLIAGINASRKLNGLEPLILKRDESYIGVLIDDLVTKGVLDPYRLLTSRSEHRLLLRHDNADKRLIKYGREVGLINEEVYSRYLDKEKAIEELENKLKDFRITPKKEINDYLVGINSATLLDSINLYDLMKRPEIGIEEIKHFIDIDYDIEIYDQVEINIKYEGYIKKAIREASKMLEYDNIKIRDDIDYEMIPNLALEARQKLKLVKPISVGQASRISGVNPADITMLMMYLKKGD
jgi:glucose-inhibited division protein A